jgi:hypothetical protein
MRNTLRLGEPVYEVVSPRFHVLKKAEIQAISD